MVPLQTPALHHSTQVTTVSAVPVSKSPALIPVSPVPIRAPTALLLESRHRSHREIQRRLDEEQYFFSQQDPNLE
ncbi:hypothetical protein NDU88_005040 [Pleurodeles waltl]|uniref:Uncharacterized protein n=1 Tax=Pleurodeles waltl TaxID=8319 RepID=A0AAV7T9A0_PLEWA|nr:hypothetical protein NDU88_005040 [Pleurodeles waltl]